MNRTFLTVWLLLGITLGAARCLHAQPTEAATSQASTDRIDLPSFGVSPPVPKIYDRDLDAQTSIVILIPRGRFNQRSPGELVYMSLAPLEKGRAADVARATSQSDHLADVHENATWGDRHDAIDVTGAGIAAAQGHLILRRTLYIEQDGFVFSLLHLADADHSDHDAAFDEIVRGTKWTKPKPAGQGVVMRKPAVRLYNGMALSIPDPFRPRMNRSSSRPSHIAIFDAMDLPSKSLVSKLMITPLPIAGGPPSLADAKQQAEQNLTEVLALSEPFRWDAAAGDEHFALTPRMKNSGGWCKVLVARADNGATTVFTLQADANDHPDAVEGIDKALDLIRASIQDHPSTHHAQQ